MSDPNEFSIVLTHPEINAVSAYLMIVDDIDDSEFKALLQSAYLKIDKVNSDVMTMKIERLERIINND